MAKDFSTMEDSNRSSNSSIHDVIAESKRSFLKTSAAVSLAALVAPMVGCASMAYSQTQVRLQSNSGFMTQRLEYRPVIQIQTVRTLTNGAQHNIAKYSTSEGLLMRNRRDDHQCGDTSQEQAPTEQPWIGVQTIFTY